MCRGGNKLALVSCDKICNFIGKRAIRCGHTSDFTHGKVLLPMGKQLSVWTHFAKIKWPLC